MGPNCSLGGGGGISRDIGGGGIIFVVGGGGGGKMSVGGGGGGKLSAGGGGGGCEVVPFIVSISSPRVFPLEIVESSKDYFVMFGYCRKKFNVEDREAAGIIDQNA